LTSREVRKALYYIGTARYSNEARSEAYLETLQALAGLIENHALADGGLFFSKAKEPGIVDCSVAAMLKGVRDVPHLKSCEAREFLKCNKHVATYLMNLDKILFPPSAEFENVEGRMDQPSPYLQELIHRRGSRPFDAFGYAPPTEARASSQDSKFALSSWIELKVSNLS